MEKSGSTYWLTRFVLLRLLGLVYAVAFLAAALQILPLIGSDGLLPIGDVICRFNPAFGQGMSVAAQEVRVLKNLLDARSAGSQGLDGLAGAFFAAIQGVLAAPWSVAESDFIYAKTRGQRPQDFPQRMKFGAALLRVAAEDAGVHQILFEVNHLMRPPSTLRAPDIVSRVTALMA